MRFSRIIDFNAINRHGTYDLQLPGVIAASRAPESES